MTNNSELENLFEAVSGKKRVEIEIDDKTVELDLHVDDLSPILTMSEDQEPDEDDMKKVIDAFRRGLKRRYMPYYDKVRDQEFENLNEEQEEENQDAREMIESILRDNMPTFFKKVPEALGWVDDIEAAMTEEDFRENNSPQK